MRAIVLTAAGLEHGYVTASLVKSLGGDLCGIVIEECPQPGTWNIALKKALTRYGYVRVGERVLTKLMRKIFHYERRTTEALKTILENCDVRWPEDMPVLRTGSVNSRESLVWIGNASPDVMFIYGTGIVGKRVLSLPTLKCLNLHTGISPYYRGSDAFFWPLYNSEPHMVGATVHECTAAIDGGDILARASVRLEENDDPFISFARCVKSGARIYSEAARNIMSGEKMRLEKQDLSSGREYRFVDRTFTHDIVMEYMVRSGKLRRIIEESFQRDLPFPLREDP